MKKNKKIIRIEEQYFVSKVRADGLETCSHIKDAMDVSELSFETLGLVVKTLIEQGYKARVEEI